MLSESFWNDSRIAKEKQKELSFTKKDVETYMIESFAQFMNMLKG